MNTSLLPSKLGQICKGVLPLPNSRPDDVFIITEDPSLIDDDEDVTIVALKELQRNIKHPEKAERLSIRKNKLVVISDDLASYVESWNSTEL